MADSKGAPAGLYFIVGILVAAVVVLAVLYFTGAFGGGKKIDVNLKKGEIHQPVERRVDIAPFTGRRQAAA